MLSSSDAYRRHLLRWRRLLTIESEREPSLLKGVNFSVRKKVFCAAVV